MDEATARGADGDEPILVSADDRVGRVVLNRPAARNAITVELATALEAALVRLADEVRLVVIRGAGGHFCVGGDIHEVQRLRADGAEGLRPLFEAFRRACEAIPTLPVPVVAAVEGYAMAGGFELVQSCDLAVVRDDAVLADNHLNFALIPGGGGTQRLPRLVGRTRALGHILTGDRLTGTQAAAWGLAHRAAPAEQFDEVLDAVVDQVVAKDPVALARAKRLVHAGLERPLSEGLDLELEAVLEHLVGDEAAAGIDQFTRTRGSRS